MQPSEANGLKAASQVMVDKIVAMPRAKCGKTIGRVTESQRIAVDRMLSVVIGLAD